ncbi:DUF5123 domain-containing protein [bacterium]|nr:DUF5123 domain-containing protein [bacterium]
MVLLAAPSAAQAATIRVPSDYPTIQAGLNVGSVGDTVLVAPGTYSDYSIFNNQSAMVAIIPDGVSIVSEAGPEQTVIDLAPLEGAAADAGAFGHLGHISGMTIIDGFRVVGFPPRSTGVSGSYSEQVEIRNCVFEADEPPSPDILRIGIVSRLSRIRVEHCSFVRCSGTSGAGITQVGGILDVTACEFIECGNQAIHAKEATGNLPHALTVRDCVFDRVFSTIGGGCIGATSLTGGLVVENCWFESPFSLGSAGAAMSVWGTGAVTISNNVFHNVNLTNGSKCLSVANGTTIVVSGNTFAHIHVPAQETSVLGGSYLNSLVFQNNVVAYTSGAEALKVRVSGPVTMGCNVFWDNEDEIGEPLDPTDRIADPQFCDLENDDLTLQSTSPCLPALSLGCDLIGALGQGCGTVGVQQESWAKVKAAYRDPDPPVGRAHNGKE